MKYTLIITLTLLTVIPSIGQDTVRIILTTQRADEPPTKQGQPKYKIEFKRNKNGDFVVADMRKDKKKIRLKIKGVIERDRIKKVAEWKTQDKNRFTQVDLGLDAVVLQEKNKTSIYKLNFDIPTNFVVRVDSFNFCKTYKLTRTISTGGKTITVTLRNNSGRNQEFTFNSNNVGEERFNLQDYIFCYTLLNDRIPNEFPHYDFFSKERLQDIILYYQKTVECEGYYYREYTDKNPSMTSQDKRTMSGWNFVEYMGQRRKK